MHFLQQDGVAEPVQEFQQDGVTEPVQGIELSPKSLSLLAPAHPACPCSFPAPPGRPIQDGRTPGGCPAAAANKAGHKSAGKLNEHNLNSLISESLQTEQKHLSFPCKDNHKHLFVTSVPRCQHKQGFLSHSSLWNKQLIQFHSKKLLEKPFQDEVWLLWPRQLWRVQ